MSHMSVTAELVFEELLRRSIEFNSGKHGRESNFEWQIEHNARSVRETRPN
jgi:hypothetical protein